jgi:hypothetical protein
MGGHCGGETVGLGHLVIGAEFGGPTLCSTWWVRRWAQNWAHAVGVCNYISTSVGTFESFAAVLRTSAPETDSILS